MVARPLIVSCIDPADTAESLDARCREWDVQVDLCEDTERIVMVGIHAVYPGGNFESHLWGRIVRSGQPGLEIMP